MGSEMCREGRASSVWAPGNDPVGARAVGSGLAGDGEGRCNGRVESDYRSLSNQAEMFKLAPLGKRRPGRACGQGHGVIRMLFSRINVAWTSERLGWQQARN